MYRGFMPRAKCFRGAQPLHAPDQAFSKKFENHRHMVALYAVWYNCIPIHKTLRVPPAMESGIVRSSVLVRGFGRNRGRIGNAAENGGLNNGRRKRRIYRTIRSDHENGRIQGASDPYQIYSTRGRAYSNFAHRPWGLEILQGTGRPIFPELRPH